MRPAARCRTWCSPPSPVRPRAPGFHFESKATVERALAASGLPHTVVAPTYFYDNALGGYQDLLAGILDLSLPEDHRLRQLDRSDLGSFAALVLADPGPFTGRRIELASDAPTPLQMSQALTAALGRPYGTAKCRGLPCHPQPGHGRHVAVPAQPGGYQADIAALRHAYPRSAGPPSRAGRIACWVRPRPSPTPRSEHSHVASMLADGTITARIRSTVELDGTGQVLDKLRTGGLRGKAVIRLQYPAQPAGRHRRRFRLLRHGP